MRYPTFLCFDLPKWVLGFAIGFLCTETGAQAQCPPNLDFEYGNFTNWKCSRGHVLEGPGGSVQLDLLPTAPTSVHTIIPSSNKELDLFGKFPKTCPNGSGYSVLLGNAVGGHEAESLSYTFTVTSAQFSITYHYAVVLENPSHQPHQQPRFRAKVIDLSSNTEINCVSFDFTASSSLPGFKKTSYSTSTLYKDWTSVTIDLGEYVGKNIRLEFITSDCTQNQHFGYAYVDVNSNCDNSYTAASLCEGDSFVTLTAPFGYETYRWFSDNSFSNIVSSTRNFSLATIPPVGTVFPVIVTPYPGFGCIDTLLASLKIQPKPQFKVGPDKEFKCTELVQLGYTSPNLNYAYSWTPADRLTNPTVSNPWLSHNIFNPMRFTVNTTNTATGCVSADSLLVTPLNCSFFVPTAFTPNNDGLNDVLKPYLGGTKGLRRFSVYNRYGNLVFSTTTEGVGWDGTYNGKAVDTGSFVWMLEYLSKDNLVMFEKGTVVVIR